jgi:hypothetical protein
VDILVQANQVSLDSDQVEIDTLKGGITIIRIK